MNTKELLIAGLLGAIITLLLTNIPFVSLINCLLCVGFWVGPLFAVWFYKRRTGSVSVSEGIWVGVIAGAIAGVVGLLLSFVGAAGASGIVNQLNMLLPADGQIDMGGAEGAIGGTIFTLIGIFIDIFFGVIGGLIGGAIFKNKSQPQV
jgi:hypothetical protein